MDLCTNTSLFSQGTCIAPEEIATSWLYAAVLESFEVHRGCLVEVFLVKIYGCKLCQFTGSIKSKIKTHLAHTDETDRARKILGCPLDHDKNESDHLGD